MTFLERLIRESKTWAFVDGLAIVIVGPLVERSPALGRVIDRWRWTTISGYAVELVYQWLLPRCNVAAGVTVREAVKYLSRRQRSDVLDAYESARRR